MLNAMQKVRMSTAMASKKPKLNPGFDSLPKEVRMKILKSKKPKMAMMKKPLKSDPSDKKITKKTQKSDKKLIQAMVALDKGKVNKALRKYKAGTRKAYKAGIISKAQKQKAVKDAIYNKPANKPKMAMKKPTLSSKSKAVERKAKKVMKNPTKKSSPRKVKAIQRKVNKQGIEGKVTVAGVKAKLSKKKVARKKKAIDRKKSMISNAVQEYISGGKKGKIKSQRLKDAVRKQKAIYRKQTKINDFSQ